MRDGTKVVIGFGSIWGLIAFGFMAISSFTIGANDTAPEILAIVLYGLSILPACIVAIWYRRAAAIWLFVLSGITALGFAYQVIMGPNRKPLGLSLFLRGVPALVVIAAIPGIIGYLLLRTSRAEDIESITTA